MGVTYNPIHGSWSITGTACPYCGTALDALVPEGDTLYCECGHEAVVDPEPVHVPEHDGPVITLAWYSAAGPVARYVPVDGSPS